MKRTDQQRKAIEVYFKQLESEFLDRGIEIKEVLPSNIDIPVTSTFLKDIFRAIGDKMYNRKSTADLEKQELTKVEEVFTNWVSKVSKGEINLEFPSQEQLDYEKRATKKSISL